MELSHYLQWRLDIKNLVQSKAWLLKNYHLQPSEVEKMPVWEWQLFVDEISRMIKEEEEERKKQEKKYQSQYKQPSFKTPSISGVPKIKY